MWISSLDFFGQQNQIIAGSIKTFMLEKSRIFEYNIYDILLNASDEIKKFLKLDDVNIIGNIES